MPRPPGLEIDAPDVLPGDFIDASVQAHARSTVERSFRVSELPRLTEAGIIEPAEVQIAVRFSVVEGHVALEGTLGGFVTMICQRCMQPVKIEVTDAVELLVVDDEVEKLEDATGYEPIVADPARLDMRWLVEEQTLLSVPLVPKHVDEGCAGDAPPSEEEGERASSQRPFADLKSLLRKG